MAKVKLTCPTWFDEIGKAEWERMYKLLKNDGMDFTDKDSKALEAYCESYSTWIRATKILQERGFTFISGNGYEQQRPEVSIQRNAQIEMRSWCKELGLSVASRTRIKKNQKDADIDDNTKNDELLEILQG